MELFDFSGDGPPLIFYIFLGVALVNVAWAFYSARPGARYPVAVPFWRETLPTDMANTLRVLSLPATTEWQHWGRTYKAEIGGAPGQMELRVAAVDARRARTVAPYWTKIRSEGMELRVTYSISPFILVGYAAAVLFFVLFFSSTDFGYVKWLFGGFMLFAFLSVPVQTRGMIRMGLRKLLSIPDLHRQ